MNTIKLITGAIAIALVAPGGFAFAVGNGSGAGAGSGGSVSGSTGGGSQTAATSVTVGAGLGDQDQDRDRDRIQDPTTHTGDEPLQTRDQDRDRLYTSTTSATTLLGTGSMNREQTQGQAAGNAGQGAMNQEQVRYELVIEPEHLQVRAQNGADLGQMVQVRQQQLEQEAASTTTQGAQQALRNANQVRLAAYSLLAAQDLLGADVGSQVAQIATQLDASVQTTANAEVQIKNRGFFTRLFFGGDARAADAIAQVIAQNQARIETLTQLLTQTNLASQVQAQLEVQVQALEQEQVRLMQLAQSEGSAWGLFSWRF